VTFELLTATVLIEEVIEALARVTFGTYERNDARVVLTHRSLVSVVEERELASKNFTSLVQGPQALLYFDLGEGELGIQAGEKICGRRMTPGQRHDQEYRTETGSHELPLQTPAGTMKVVHGPESSVSLRDRATATAEHGVRRFIQVC
jgi:hypothetical protein